MQVDWDGAVNAHRVAPGLFRMGRRESLTAAGWQRARADGVRTVVDLRSEHERRPRPTDPEVDVGALDGLSVVLAPTEDPSAPGFADRFGPYLDTPAGYPDYLALFGDRVAGAVAAVGGAHGAVVVQCSAGRDRTGLVVALGQRAAGLDVDEVVAGWVAAAEGINAYHVDHHHPRESHLTGASWTGFLEPRVTALLSFLTSLDAVGFLSAHGLSDADLDAVARRFRGEGAA